MEQLTWNKPTLNVEYLLKGDIIENNPVVVVERPSSRNSWGGAAISLIKIPPGWLDLPALELQIHTNLSDSLNCGQEKSACFCYGENFYGIYTLKTQFMRNYLLFKLRKEWQNKSWWELSNLFQIHLFNDKERTDTLWAWDWAAKYLCGRFSPFPTSNAIHGDHEWRRRQIIGPLNNSPQ